MITWCVDYILIRTFFKSHLQLHFYFELSEYGLLWSQQSVGASTPAPAPWETPLTHCGHSMLSVTSWWSTARHQSMATSETESTIVTGTCNHLFTAYRKFRYLDSKVWSVCKLQFVNNFDGMEVWPDRFRLLTTWRLLTLQCMYCTVRIWIMLMYSRINCLLSSCKGLLRISHNLNKVSRIRAEM